jgi:uncharacterized protein (TIGR03083 family)
MTIDVNMISALDHREAIALQGVELQRFLDVVRTLEADDWGRPVGLDGWDVRQVVLHVLATSEMSASPFETLRQQRRARSHRRRHGVGHDAALLAVQFEARATLTPQQIVDRLADAAPRAVRRRSKLVGWFRRHTHVRLDGRVPERVTLGSLVDVIALREPWMHRLDVCRAVGRSPVLTSDHDGRIVADAVRDWAARHAAPLTLVLTGPAGGAFRSGEGGESIARDAIDWSRAVAGRGEHPSGLLATPIPF